MQGQWLRLLPLFLETQKHPSNPNPSSSRAPLHHQTCVVHKCRYLSSYPTRRIHKSVFVSEAYQVATSLHQKTAKDAGSCRFDNDRVRGERTGAKSMMSRAQRARLSAARIAVQMWHCCPRGLRAGSFVAAQWQCSYNGDCDSGWQNTLKQLLWHWFLWSGD